MTRQQVANKSGSISSSGRPGQPDALSCLPASFVTRGVRTPFTTKSLRYARVLIGQSGDSDFFNKNQTDYRSHRDLQQFIYMKVEVY